MFIIINTAFVTGKIESYKCKLGNEIIEKNLFTGGAVDPSRFGAGQLQQYGFLQKGIRKYRRQK